MIAASTDQGLVRIEADGVVLEGNLRIPEKASGVVLFAHGSGSSRFSSRNRYVAEQLRAAGVGTLLIDLLTQDEEQIDLRTAHLRFDIGLLAGRLAGTIEWLEHEAQTQRLKVGLFGASTGGGAALVAAARRPDRVAAVVPRGGGPDLAGPSLPHVEAPTLLIVGGDDTPVIAMNRDAYAQMHCVRRLEIVPGATHLFEETGALEQVATLAGARFRAHLR